ncbi:MAG: heat-inducible transcriptional repressor HrcA [Fusobacteriaceae bacterium]
MNEREKLVLNAIVNYYLTFGDTIGSRALVKRYGIDFSSATIRNVMVDLEEGGYIAKTHASSGRIPTDKGYRYYLNELLEIEKISIDQKKRIKTAYEKKIEELDVFLQETSNLLSRLTNYAGLVIEPDHDKEKIKKIELVHIEDDLLMAVIVMENKAIRTKKIHLEEKITRDEVQELTKDINERLMKNEFSENELKNLLEKTEEHGRYLEIEAAIEKELSQNIEGKLFINTDINIQGDSEDNAKVMQFFHQNRDIKSIFEELVHTKDKNYGSVNVLFGDELNIKGLENYSFVYSAYKLGNSEGIVGVIGPKRMAYSKTIGLVEYVADKVNKVIEKIDKKEVLK